jgi:hypothetical protein
VDVERPAVADEGLELVDPAPLQLLHEDHVAHRAAGVGQEPSLHLASERVFTVAVTEIAHRDEQVHELRGGARIGATGIGNLICRPTTFTERFEHSELRGNHDGARVDRRICLEHRDGNNPRGEDGRLDWVLRHQSNAHPSASSACPGLIGVSASR